MRAAAFCLLIAEQAWGLQAPTNRAAARVHVLAPHTTRTSGAQLLARPTVSPADTVGTVGTVDAVDHVDTCVLDDTVRACDYDASSIDSRFADDPLHVAGRVATIAFAAARVKLAGDDGGATLRTEMSQLGPVFCKVGQTLATRPDIVGLETSRSLSKLQANKQKSPTKKPVFSHASLTPHHVSRLTKAPNKRLQLT